MLRVARELAARGHRTRLLVGYATPTGIAMARAHGLEPEIMPGHIDRQWRCDTDFADWLEPRLVGVDVVHAHMVGAWWAAAQAIPAGVPLLASEHNDYTWPGAPQWAAMGDAVDRIDRFYAHSPSARDAILEVGMAPDRVVRGISPIEGFDAIPRPGLPVPRMIYTGRLTKDKGIDVLIEALALMTAPPPLLVLGAGVLEPTLVRRIAALGLGTAVRLCGWVDDPAPWVAGAAVQICPSREEAFSQAAVLAMALGVPVVGTRVDGFPRTLGEGRGLSVLPEDPAALATMLADLLEGRQSTDLDGARDWAQQFAIGRVTTRYEIDYHELGEPVAA